MAREAVVLYRCDGCKKMGEPEPYPENSRIAPRFRKEWVPKGWAEMRVMGNQGDDFFNAQYCDTCLTELERLLEGLALSKKSLSDIPVVVESQIELKEGYEMEQEHKMEKIRFNSREDAVSTLEALLQHVVMYGVVSVADLYDLVGFDRATYLDTRWGWHRKAIDETSVCQLTDTDTEEYALSLPQPVSLKLEKESN